MFAGAHAQPRTAAIRWLALLCLLLSLALAGCQLDLHTKIKEEDVNEMLGALRAAGLDAHKTTPDGGKSWTLTVEESQVVQAIKVLRDEALPRERRASLGDLFKKEGLISSPTEERVRFLYGMEQELAETISKIDGVMVARVHIVLPNNDPLAPRTKPSTASVFVKHRVGTDLVTLVPAIKNLVVHAVEGLTYDQVTVTVVSADRSEAGIEEHRLSQAPVAESAWSDNWGMVLGLAGLGMLLFAAGVGIAVLLMRRQGGSLPAVKSWLPGKLRRGGSDVGISDR